MADLHLATTTKWTDIIAAQNNPDLMAACLKRMAEKYHPLIQRFIARTLRIRNPETADDLTQSFFLHLIESNALLKLDRERGRLRSWLAATARNFVWDEIRKADRDNHASPFLTFTPLPDGDVMDTNSLTPEEEMYRDYARHVMADATVALRRYCQDKGKPHYFQVFLRHVDGDGREPRYTYEETAAEYGISVTDVSNIRQRMKKRFNHLLRSEVQGLIGTNVDVEDELEQLSQLLNPRSQPRR